MRILVAEDEKDLNRLVCKTLERAGYGVDACYDGEEALDYAAGAAYDCILLDIMMPKLDGHAVLRALRNKGSVTPVIFLTARDSVQDRITGLDLGADDYLVKPFDLDELLARIRAATRKYSAQKTSVLTLGDLTVDTSSHTVTRAGQNIKLSAKEYAILEYMMQHKGTVISRARLEDHIWNYDYTGGSNVVDVYITYLRKKIDQGFDKKLLHTVRGAGWILKEDT
ncbi:response regulator transcription factor [Intestinibacillus sp. Marseille-P6563]|uniref:response regulator transcription factor n=1 Tax=Intestinibacillus sp. Marseille-P6563 TaxID=2364792 RepID=UPI000F06FE1F|nr:response regulator transcription factor [Intestinibacillus sp. Marseille-P6563]